MKRSASASAAGAPRPRPPILTGGAPSPRLFEHIAEYADGWLPIGGAGVAAAVPDVHRAFERAARGPGAPAPPAGITIA
ncbi:hypothetical protein BE17_29060 [Sorangium cellulosum]|uniref:Luciferase-like domain-containing protein n=1 Tax=Sorangium cellulosum TaxID=56 RepID=A0A150S2N0_SORCE|nr:hypothetical protein BE17_29060 [Sorangium cellulosum]